MGALAPVSSPWIPEDDLILKNAVEAGASLEALAKGAVCFSRRFTLTELQNRWYALLYDKDISTVASARILEIGHSVYSKHSKISSFKVKESFSEKRKLSSLRCHYHALRKRACMISCAYGGSELNMTSATGHVNGNNAFVDHVNVDLRFDSEQDAFPEMQRIYTGASDVDHDSCAFNIGHVDSDAAHAYHSLSGFPTDDMIVESLDHQIPGNNPDTNRICGYNDISRLQGDKTAGESLHQISEKRVDHNDRPHILGDGYQSHPGNQKIEPLPNLSSNNCFEVNNVETKSLCALDPSNNIQEKNCAGFGENRNIKTEDMNCTHSFHHLGYSSPLPEIPLWRTSHETDMQVTSTAGKIEGEEHGVVQSIPSGGDITVHPTEFDGTLSDPSLCDEICFGASDEGGDFMDMSLSFTSDGEPFLFGADGKGIIDKSCFDGLTNFLMNSPIANHQDHIHNKTESNRTNTADILNTCPTVSHVVSTGDSTDAGKQKCSEQGGGSDSIDSTSLADTSSKVLCPYGPLQGPVICILNTEDTDIPCNDDIVLPPRGLATFSPPDLESKFKSTSLLDSSTKIFMDNGNASLLNNIKEGQEASQHNLISAATQLCPLRQKPEPQHLENASSARASKNACNDVKLHTNTTKNSSPSTEVIASNNDITIRVGQHANFGTFKDFSLEKSERPCHDKNAHVGASSILKEVEEPVQVYPPSYEEGDPGQMGYPGSVQTALTSDHDERYSDDDDLPCFSDVEAMILDMDLSADEQESFYFSQEVSRYRHMDTKKTIIRLEQGANSYIQKAIALKGAFAVFYGRHMKYYINKSQVLIGRGTQEICVDIDLQNEGRANKISRRQAIIQMDNNGAFSIRNMGKFPIQVNDKELLTGKCCNLSSGCLIEIRGMSFMFEVNCKCLRQYLSNNSRTDSKIYNSNCR